MTVLNEVCGMLDTYGGRDKVSNCFNKKSSFPSYKKRKQY